jgi:hypothetical protein
LVPQATFGCQCGMQKEATNSQSPELCWPAHFVGPAFTLPPLAGSSPSSGLHPVS